MPTTVSSPEATFAIGVVLVLGAILVFRWLRREAASPDPWGQEVEDALRRDEALPLCPHCLAPQEHETWFCAECGNSIGAYNNLNPYLYLFSIGDLFRNGTTGWARPRPIVTAGFVLLVPWVFPVWVQSWSIVSNLAGVACWILFWVLFFGEQARSRAGVEAPPSEPV